MSDKNTAGGAFDALLAEISGQADDTETLAKAINDAGDGDGDGDDKDDAKIKAAAEEGAADGEGKEGDEEPFGKALTFTDDKGVETTGYDATDLIKSLVDRADATDDAVKTGFEKLLGVIKTQGDMIKSLNDQVRSMGRQGAGRRSTLVVTDKPGGATELAKSLAADAAADTAKDGMPREEFFAKALQAAEQGLISYHQANLSETLVNKGGQPLPEVLKAVAKIADK